MQIRAYLQSGRVIVAALASVAIASAIAAPSVDPRSDAPEARSGALPRFVDAASFADALRRWQGAEDINAWIGARFEYDPARALQLSETRRSREAGAAIHAPEQFFAAARGICVDLARFAVEVLRAIDPAAQGRYLMIEFAPLTIGGQVLRRHWVATFVRDGQLYVFADSKRPGHIAGPYATLRDFIDEYARYRQRDIVAFRQADSYARQSRTAAAGRAGERQP